MAAFFVSGAAGMDFYGHDNVEGEVAVDRVDGLPHLDPQGSPVARPGLGLRQQHGRGTKAEERNRP